MPACVRAATVVSVLAGALALSACGGGGSPSHSSTHSTGPRSKPSQHVIAPAAASSALLASDGVGSLLKPAPYRRPTKPLYCRPAGSPTVAKESGATSVTGVYFTSANPKADLTEDVYLYPSSAKARSALNMVQGDMDCAGGRIYGSDGKSIRVAVGPSIDYSAKLKAEFAYGWSLRTVSTRGIEFAIPVGTALLLIHYEAGAKSRATKLPDAFDVARAAFDRLAHA